VVIRENLFAFFGGIIWITIISCPLTGHYFTFSC
jgi:hypothetical protein